MSISYYIILRPFEPTSHPPPYYRYNDLKHLKVLFLNGMYGFSEEMCQHRTLMDLVLHYEQNSLKVHNKTLTTSLKYPVKADR